MKIVLLVLFIAAAFAAPKFQDTHAVLAELDKDHFGSTFISAIALNMATKAPLEEITLLIDQIMKEIQTEQAEADKKNAIDEANCSEKINSLTKQIAELKTSIASTENAIKDNEDILSNAKVNLAQTIKDYEETVEQITTGTAQREAEHAKWADEDYQNSISIATLEEGVKLIQHMIHGVAFSQIQARYDKVLDKLKTQEKHGTLFKPLITSLTQLATKLNYENVMKILELLKNIRVGIVEEQEAARAAEKQAQEDWEVLLAHLTNQKQMLADKRARLEALIESTEQLLKQLRESLERMQTQLENAQVSLAATQAECKKLKDTYETETSERERELAILKKLVDHLNEKFSKVAEYVEGRVAPEF